MMAETEHLLSVLRSAVRMLGHTNQEIEDRLGVYHGYLGRLFKGTIQLQYEDIVKIARALDMEPGELFQLVYPQTSAPPTEGAKRLREKLNLLQPAVATPEAVVPEPAAPPVPATAASDLSSKLAQDLDELVQQKLEQLVAGLFKGPGRQ